MTIIVLQTWNIDKFEQYFDVIMYHCDSKIDVYCKINQKKLETLTH